MPADDEGLPMGNGAVARADAREDHMTSPPSRTEDRVLLADAVREAGALAASLQAKGVESWRKGDGTPVTEADIAVDRLLRERLTTDRPGYGWLSEETRDDPIRLTRRRVWVVDPIDGTRAFMAGGNEWAISAALVEDGRPVLAAVYNVAGDAFYAAGRDAGAELDGRAIAVSARTELEGCRILARDSVLAPARWNSPLPPMHAELRKSIALRLCLVADGTFDANLATGETSDWDIAAADLIVTEAGGLMSTLDGAAPVYNRERPRHTGVVAAGFALHEQIIEHMRGYREAWR